MFTRSTTILALIALLVAEAVAVAQSADAPIRSVSAERRAEPGLLLTSIEAEDTVFAGRALISSFRLPAAKSTFERLLAGGENDAAARYHLAGIAFLYVMFEQREPYFSEFFAESDALSDALDDADDSAWRSFLEAENYLMRSFVRARQGDFLRTAVSAREAYERYLDALRADRTLIDAQTGIGLLKALIGATPPAYRRFLNLFGYKGTVEEGIRLLDHAASRARYNGDQAALFRDLTRIYMNRERSTGTRILGDRWREDPNTGSGLLYAFALRYDRKPEQAVEVAREAIELGETGEFAPLSFLHFHLGSALYSLNRFDEAEADLRRYTEVFSGQSFLSTAYVRLGVSLEMMGRRDDAVTAYRAVTAPTEFDIDLAAKREAERRLDDPLSEAGMDLVKGQNAVASGRYDEAVEVLELVFYRPESSDLERTEAAYWLGRAYQNHGKKAEAATKFTYVRMHPVDEDQRWAPWATYYLGKIRRASGQKEEARALFQEVLDHKGDYDFKKSLHRNARLAIDRL